MNKHINKNKRVKANYAARTGCTIEPVEFDHIPVEVATTMLCTTRPNNRERKMFMAAREKRYESTLSPKLPEDRIRRKLRAATWEQLGTWNARLTTRTVLSQLAIAFFQRKLAKLGEITEKTTKETLAQARLWATKINLLHARGTAMQLAQGCVEDEIERRRNFWARLKHVAPTVAAAIENK